MLIPFAIASGAVLASLMLALYATFYFGNNGPQFYPVKMLLSTGVAFTVAKVSSLAYAALSLPSLPSLARVKPAMFLFTSLATIGGLLFAQGHVRMSLTQDQFETGGVALYLAAWILLGYEGYRVFSFLTDKFARVLIGFVVCAFVLAMGLTLLAIAIDLAVQNMNEYYASAVAAWAGTLSAAAIRNLNAKDNMTSELFSYSVEAFLKRDIPTMIAAAIAFVAFKAFHLGPPILFPILVGALAGIIGAFWQTAAHDI